MINKKSTTFIAITGVLLLAEYLLFKDKYILANVGSTWMNIPYFLLSTITTLSLLIFLVSQQKKHS